MSALQRLARDVRWLQRRVRRLETIGETPVWGRIDGMFLSLPVLRAYWPMSAVGHAAAGRATDIANGNSLTASAGTGTVHYVYDGLVPYARFVSANTQFLYATDAGASDWADILASEGYVLTANQGLTVGGWFQTSDVTTRQALIGKWHPYLLEVGNTASTVRFLVRDVGGASQTSSGNLGTPVDDTWFFAVGRYTLGAVNDEVAVFLDGSWSTADVATFAPLSDSAADFEIGRRNNGATNYLDGYASRCFLCACALADDTVMALFQQSRAGYGV